MRFMGGYLRSNGTKVYCDTTLALGGGYRAIIFDRDTDAYITHARFDTEVAAREWLQSLVEEF